MIHHELDSHLNLAEGLSRRRTPLLKPFFLPSRFQYRRSALHYAARCPDADRRVKISETIRNAGADGDALDAVSAEIKRNLIRNTRRQPPLSYTRLEVLKH